MKRAVLIIVLILNLPAYSQAEAIFNRATDAYNEGDYEKSVSMYNQIMEGGLHSAALYFNLANSHYKLNQIAPSIYYYEKALLLKPNDTEIRTNLAFAQNMTLDAIEVLPETGISKIYQRITGRMSFDQWAYTSVVFLLLFVLAYLAFYFLSTATQKRIAFIGSLTSLMIAIISVVFAFMQYTQFKAEQPAIIFSEEVSVKAEPNQRSEEAFVLHEGTKVNVLEELNDYNRIQLADGKTGWMLSTALKMLKDF